MPRRTGRDSRETAKLQLKDTTQIKVSGADSGEVYSHHRQIERYVHWFNEYPGMAGLESPAYSVLQALPDVFRLPEG